MNIIEMLSKEISKSLGKGIKAMKELGLPKDVALKTVSYMVEYAYASPDERKNLTEERKKIGNRR